MGDRGQVHIKNTGVFLYTHWGATELIQQVHTALSKKWRWDDDEYLTRIIFDVMIGNEQGSETGYGIGNEQHGDVWRLVEIDCSKQTVKIIDNDTIILSTSFEDFITLDIES